MSVGYTAGCENWNNGYMSWFTRNNGKEWAAEDVRKLKQLAKKGTPTRVIGLELGRTTCSVSTKAAQEGVSLLHSNLHHKKPQP